MTTRSRLLALLRPHRGRVAAAMGLAGVVLTGLLTIPLLARAVLGRALAGEGLPALLAVLAVPLLGALAAASYAAFRITFEVSGRIVCGLRRDYVAALLDLPLEEHRRRNPGELIDRLGTALERIEFFLRYTLILIPSVVLLVLGGTVLLLAMSWKLTLVLFATVAGCSLVFRFLFGAVRRAEEEGSAEAGTVMARIHDLLASMETVQAFDAGPYHLRALDRAHDRFLSLRARSARFAALIEPVVLVAALGAILALLFLGGALVARGEIEPGTLIAFLLYALILLPQGRVVSLVSLRWQAFESGLAAIDAVRSGPVRRDPPGAVALPEPVRGEIRFIGVDHAYGEGPPVLSGFDLHVVPHERVGIVGASGAGKTTLFRLLLGLHRSRAGRIEIDGVDIATVTAASLRRTVSLVPQDVALLDDTVLENVRYGAPHADEDAVRSACRAAGVDELIRTLPDGERTHVGARGLKLSGGERQRIAIARAVLRDAPILLLDEATAALDPETEQRIRDALDRIAEGRTLLVVAHRPGTVRDLDRIVVLHDGAVADSGSHEVLVERCPRYRELMAARPAGHAAAGGVA